MLPATRPPCGCAERGMASPPSLHCVAPLSYPPPPLRGSPATGVTLISHPLELGLRLGWRRSHRSRGAAQRRGPGLLAGAYRPPRWGAVPLTSPADGLRPPAWLGAPKASHLAARISRGRFLFFKRLVSFEIITSLVGIGIDRNAVTSHRICGSGSLVKTLSRPSTFRTAFSLKPTLTSVV